MVADATRRREEALAQLGAIDLAWREVLVDAASIGHLSAATIAEVAGVSRGRSISCVRSGASVSMPLMLAVLWLRGGSRE